MFSYSKQIFFISFLSCAYAPTTVKYNYQQIAIIDDLPTAADLSKYLSALEKGLAFINMHKHYVDMNLSFGLFLSNVNLRAIRRYEVSDKLKARLLHLLFITEDVLEYFYKVILNHKHTHRSMLKPILSLYINETSWLANLQKLNKNLLKKTKFYFRKDLDKRYLQWDIYKRNIRVNESEPSPGNKDDCFNLLAQNPVREDDQLPFCHVSYECASFILKGPNFGYGMLNRLLLIIMAKFSRNCVIGDIEDVKHFLDDKCAQMYNEAEYISNYEFREPNLMLEQIVLCSLLGHSQFLRESWLDELMEFQTKIGCFNTHRLTRDNTVMSIPDEETKDWVFTKSKPTIWSGTCFRHITGIGFAVLTSVIRYLVESYHSNL